MKTCYPTKILRIDSNFIQIILILEFYVRILIQTNLAGILLTVVKCVHKLQMIRIVWWYYSKFAAKLTIIIHNHQTSENLIKKKCQTV